MFDKMLHGILYMSCGNKIFSVKKISIVKAYILQVNVQTKHLMNADTTFSITKKLKD